ncbi:hypothetical protein PVAP13_1KG171705 [Panicum virgatum]|uniref:Uncharacterized protein n=1 Tax=Panicum virgatum TaxID=38727 RepID=A0A8T0XQM8_PANVG|nr:hypothetical protein PVAP13_1KG171705 [Panicum virgatum]
MAVPISSGLQQNVAAKKRGTTWPHNSDKPEKKRASVARPAATGLDTTKKSVPARKKHRSSFRGPRLRHPATTRLPPMVGRQKIPGTRAPRTAVPGMWQALPRIPAGREGGRRKDQKRIPRWHVTRSARNHQRPPPHSAKIRLLEAARCAECGRYCLQLRLHRTKEAAPAHRRHHHFRQEEGRGSSKSESRGGQCSRRQAISRRRQEQASW